MADEPTLIQSREREVHTSSSGIEIQRTFYFEPYSSFPAVVEALQGKVEKGVDGIWTRTPPAADPYIPSCFCNEARVSLTDPHALTTSPDIMTATLADGVTEVSTLKEYLETQREDPTIGAAGGYAVASYRPLITAWPYDPQQGAPDNRWDWLEPQFSPAFKQVPWPDGFFAIGHDPFQNPFPQSIPKDLAEPVTIPVTDFSIRRILVGEPAWNVLKSYGGCVNSITFPTHATPPAHHLPAFPRGTLKFETYEVANRLDGAGNRWYEITLYFSWLNLFDELVGDTAGNLKPGFVTWNHALTRGPPVGTGPLAWYYIARKTVLLPIPLIPIVPDLAIIGGSLYKYAAFDKLFQLNP